MKVVDVKVHVSKHMEGLGKIVLIGDLAYIGPSDYTKLQGMSEEEGAKFLNSLGQVNLSRYLEVLNGPISLVTEPVCYIDWKKRILNNPRKT